MKTKLLLSLILMLAFIMQQAQAQDYIIIEDFEDPEAHIPLNNITDGSVEEPFEVIANPDPSEVNDSDYVLQYTRAYDGNPWGGFYSEVFEPLDMDDMKYTHYQVWKPRVSPVWFKVEDSDSEEGDDFEFESMEPQELMEEWETITFHYPDAVGSYSIINVQPDREDPVTLEENITIYMDNIILSNSADDPLATSIEQDELPVQVALKQNYPNPFNPATSITFELNNAEQVSLKVYNALGQEVATLVDGLRSSGQHQVSFNADEMSSGIYFYRLQTSSRSITRSMTLVK